MSLFKLSTTSRYPAVKKGERKIKREKDQTAAPAQEKNRGEGRINTDAEGPNHNPNDFRILGLLYQIVPPHEGLVNIHRLLPGDSRDGVIC